VRKNSGGILYSLVYGHVIAEQIDPVEKKPLFHFLPSTLTYSIATVGCNLTCLNCQNHSIAHFDIARAGVVPGTIVSPEQVVSRAVDAGCRSISFTYTEPTIYFEYALDVARLSRQAGLRNIFVSNGYITPEALDLIAPYLDAANIDLKGFSEEFYQSVTGGSLSQVLECICDYHSRGIWLELTTLLIPGKNDDRDSLEGIAGFIADRLGDEVPWHISRFFPNYRMTDLPATPLVTLDEAAAIAERAGLQYVYLGNVPGRDENTRCFNCGAVCIWRNGYHADLSGIQCGTCRHCAAVLPGVWI
jgi:pyruvate formate lyase activating enzyme